METSSRESRIRAALQEEEARQDKCVCCGRRFGGPSVNNTPIVCIRCGRKSCYGTPCSKPAPLGWNCILCHVKREMESSSGSWTDVKSEEEVVKVNGRSRVSQNDGPDTFQVREFIEKLVERIIGGRLDAVTVGKLSNASAYTGMFSKYHDPLCQVLARLGFALHFSLANKDARNDEESPSSAHAALSQLIQKIANDAELLPNLSPVDTSIEREASTNTNGKSYEDILATAILNKVIEKYQRRNGYFKELDDNRNFTKIPSSHLDDDNRSGSDWSDRSRSEPLALKIEEHIEEVTTTYESSGEDPDEDIGSFLPNNRRVPFPEFGVDIVDGNEARSSSEDESESCTTDLISTPSTWEENWLFQTKKQKQPKSSHHPVPVPMLVPNPSQDFKALIGGIDAEDISDLSECSESALEEAMSEATEDPIKVQEMIDALNHDQEELEQDEPSRVETSETITRSDENTISQSSETPSAVFEDLSSGDTQLTADSLETDEISPSPSPSLIQQDRDIPVDYAEIAQIDAPPIPKPRSFEVSKVEVQGKSESEDELEDKPFCPIAEREKAKWNNAIEMKDNPYTPENIAKRAKNRSMLFTRANAVIDSVEFPAELSPEEELELPQRRYSRDYYVKNVSSPVRSAESPVSFRSEASLEDTDTQYIEEISEDVPEVKLEEQKSNVDHQTSVDTLGLPCVKELRKSFNEPYAFTTSKPPLPPRYSLPNRKIQEEPKKEEEVDYSITPVSEIITNLTKKVTAAPEPKNKQEEVFKEISELRNGNAPVELLQKDSSHKVGNDSSVEENVSDSFEEPAKMEPLFKKKKPIRPVHSLTARSIPKDFREGLKRSSTSLKSISTPSGEIYSATDENFAPPLNIDLRKRKQFWEEQIAKSKP